MPTSKLENVFRHGYGVLVGALVKRFGSAYLALVEDAVQQAMMRAMETWVRSKVPDKPEAWLYKVAYRELLCELRKRKFLVEDSQYPAVSVPLVEDPDIPLKQEMHDSMIRLLFVACHPDLPEESQLVFTLKSISGFSVEEIATRLYTSTENVYKRYTRARNKLQECLEDFDSFTDETLHQRLATVLKVLYLMFTEGYFSSQGESAIRKELCAEAIRLMSILNAQNRFAQPEVKALLALMYLHFARFEARQGGAGQLILLEYQDRQRWHADKIATGVRLLSESTQGQTLSKFHIEAGIAAEHCLSSSYANARWDKIVRSYELLKHYSSSPLHHLNHAIALCEWQGPTSALVMLDSCDLPQWLTSSYNFYSVKAFLLNRNVQSEEAKLYAQQAFNLAPSEHIRCLLQ